MKNISAATTQYEQFRLNFSKTSQISKKIGQFTTFNMYSLKLLVFLKQTSTVFVVSYTCHCHKIRIGENPGLNFSKTTPSILEKSRRCTTLNM